jgi:hypothetical protein
MPQTTSENEIQEIRAELNRNRLLLEKIYEASEKTRQYVRWLKILSLVKIISVALLVIVSYLIIMPFFNEVINRYSGI